MTKVIWRNGRISAKALQLILLSGVFLLFLSSSVFVEIASAQTDAEVLQAECVNKYALADDLWHSAKYGEAKVLYQYVAQKSSDSNLAIKCQSRVACCEINLGNYSAAEQAINTLKTDYSEHPELCTNLDTLNEEYWFTAKYDEAKVLYQYIYENSPDSDLALSCRVWVVGCEIRLGNDNAADQALKTLKNDYSKHKNLYTEIFELAYDCIEQAKSGVLNGSGNKYMAVKEYERAQRFCQDIVDNCSDREALLLGHAGVELAQIYLNNDPNDSQGTTVVDALIAEFNDVPRLDWCVFVIGEEYYDLASTMRKQGLKSLADRHFLKAINVWERIINELPVSEQTTHAHYYSGIAYQYIGDDEEAVQYYQAVVDQWPDYKYAWGAQFRIGKCYDNLIESGKLSKSVGNAARKAAYQKVIQNYPECKAVATARTRLSQLK